MMNRSTGWDGSVCATVTASDSQRNTVNGRSMTTTWKFIELFGHAIAGRDRRVRGPLSTR